MKTIKFIGLGVDYANVMTDEGESICKLRFREDAYRHQMMDGRLYLYLEGNDKPVAVFAEKFYFCCDNGKYEECKSIMKFGDSIEKLRGIDGPCPISWTSKRLVASTSIKRNEEIWNILIEI